MSVSRRSDNLALNAVLGLGVLATLVGLVLLSGTCIGAGPVEALGAMAGQLPTTLPVRATCGH